jgi:adenylate kinase
VATFILLVGVQGSGKGTQAKRIVEKYGLPHISTGDLFRAMDVLDTPLARQIREIRDAGKLVPDEITIEVVRERLRQPDAANGVLFDGFPRTTPQAEALDNLLNEFGAKVDLVLLFQLAREKALDRIAIRHQQEQRADDTPEKANKRINDFYNITLPQIVEQVYQPQGIVAEIDADQSIDSVWTSVQAAIDKVIVK